MSLTKIVNPPCNFSFYFQKFTKTGADLLSKFCPAEKYIHQIGSFYSVQGRFRKLICAISGSDDDFIRT